MMDQAIERAIEAFKATPKTKPISDAVRAAIAAYEAAAEIDRLRAERDALATYAERYRQEIERLCAINDSRNETIKRLETETHQYVVQLQALRAPAGDEALRTAVSTAIDSFGGMLHSEKISAVLAAVVPGVVARERERCAAIANDVGTTRWHGTRLEDACDEVAAAIRTGAPGHE
jgi:hypothetical protein